MFFENHFTSHAEEVLRSAHERASALGHGFVGSEHLLLALAKSGRGKSYNALISEGISYDAILCAVCEEVGKGERGRSTPQGLTPCAQRIVRLAQSIATGLGYSAIGEDHLLVAIFRDGKNTAAAILKKLKADEGRVVRLLLGGGGERDEDMRRGDGAKTAREGSNLKTLKSFGRDMTALAASGKLDPVIGRERELVEMICVLTRRSKNNPILIGDAGVGKTALAEGLARKIVSGDVPQNLLDKRIFAVDIATVVAGTKYRGEFEERIKTMLSEVARAKDIILFIDEIHTIVGAGAAEGAIDAANILKPALSRREIQLIGATTSEEYRKYIERDPAMARRFGTILVEEPSDEECKKIIKGLAPKYEAHHGCEISDEAIESAVHLSKRYMTERRLPDKAIDLIDEALSRKRIESSAPSSDMKKLEEELRQVLLEKRSAIRDEKFPLAAEFKAREEKLALRLEEEKEKWQRVMEGKNCICGEDIARTISKQKKIPLCKITRSERERLLKLPSELSKKVVGQDRAVNAVVRAIRRSRSIPSDERKPQGSFLFAGPTGVGKTLLCTALAECFFEGRDRLIRLDMSEYMEKHTVARILGAPPGYVGHNSGETLVDRVRKKPYSVVLFDEIEKAHPDIFNILLQILEDGTLTDSNGRCADFCNTIVVMTSNIGAEKMTSAPVGFSTDGSEREDALRRAVESEIKKTIRPELVGRLDEIIVFSKLTKENLREILDGLLEKLILRAKRGGIELRVEESAREKLSLLALDLPYGARGLRKLILREIEDELSLLAVKKESEMCTEVSFKDGKFVVSEVDAFF